MPEVMYENYVGSDVHQLSISKFDARDKRLEKNGDNQGAK